MGFAGMHFIIKPWPFVPDEAVAIIISVPIFSRKLSQFSWVLNSFLLCVLQVKLGFCYVRSGPQISKLSPLDSIYGVRF